MVFKPIIVDSTKPPEIHRARCPEHGIVTDCIPLLVGPMIGKTGKVMKKHGNVRYYCVDCLVKGIRTEVGR